MGKLFTLRDYYPSGAACVSPPALAAQFTAANSERLTSASTAFSPGDADFSIAGWFYPDTNANQGIVAKWGGGGDASYNIYCVSWNSDVQLRFSAHDGAATGSVYFTTTYMLVGQWNFFAAWHDATADRIYVQLNDGTPIESSAYTGGIGASSNPLSVGYDQSAYANGRAFCIGYWDEVLSAADLAALYNSGEPVAYCALPASLKTNLVSYWNLDEESGTRADSHGSNDLTDNNTVTSVAWNS